MDVGSKPYQCYLCGDDFETAPEFLLHYQSHSIKEKRTAEVREGNFRCTPCGLYFTNKAMLALHFEQAHIAKKKKEVSQVEEKKRLPVLPTQKQKMPPPQPKLFANLTEMIRARPDGGYDCGTCGAQFAEKATVIRHYRESAHTINPKHVTAPKRSYRCIRCGASFLSPGSLQVHLINIHNIRRKALFTYNDAEKPVLKCGKCGFQCETEQALQDHFWSSGCGTCLCDLCDLSFTNDLDLAVHKAEIHEKDLETNSTSSQLEVHEESVLPPDHSNAVSETDSSSEVDQFEEKDEVNSESPEEEAEVGASKTSSIYICSVCHSTFNDKVKLAKHKKEVHNVPNEDLPLKKAKEEDGSIATRVTSSPRQCTSNCGVCQRRFTSVRACKAHFWQKHGAKSIEGTECCFCRRPFPSTASLRAHVIVYHSLDDDEVSDEDSKKKQRKTVPSSSAIRAELPRDKIGYFQCPRCTAVYKSQVPLLRHSQVACPNLPFPFQCNFCKIAFRDIDKLTEHTEHHMMKEPFSCDFCAEIVPEDKYRDHNPKCAYLLQHPSSAGEKPDCKFQKLSPPKIKAIRKTQPVKYKREKWGKTPPLTYNCSGCLKTLKTPSALGSHVKKYCSHIQEPYQCGICLVMHTELRHLKRHIYQTHREQLPIPCKKCQVKIKPGELKKHICLDAEESQSEDEEEEEMEERNHDEDQMQGGLTGEQEEVDFDNLEYTIEMDNAEEEDEPEYIPFDNFVEYVQSAENAGLENGALENAGLENGLGEHAKFWQESNTDSTLGAVKEENVEYEDDGFTNPPLRKKIKLEEGRDSIDYVKVEPQSDHGDVDQDSRIHLSNGYSINEDSTNELFDASHISIASTSGAMTGGATDIAYCLTENGKLQPVQLLPNGQYVKCEEGVSEEFEYHIDEAPSFENQPNCVIVPSSVESVHPDIYNGDGYEENFGAQTSGDVDYHEMYSEENEPVGTGSGSINMETGVSVAPPGGENSEYSLEKIILEDGTVSMMLVHNEGSLDKHSYELHDEATEVDISSVKMEETEN